MKRPRTSASEVASLDEMKAGAAFDPLKIPIDILPLIFEHLIDRRDLHVCAQLHSTFHAAATPLLYRTLDSRVMKTRLGVRIIAASAIR